MDKEGSRRKQWRAAERQHGGRFPYGHFEGGLHGLNKLTGTVESMFHMADEA